MKKIIFTIFIIQCSLLITYAQTGWFQQNANINYQLYSVFFIDSQTGFILAREDSSVVLRTSNGGNNWDINYRTKNFTLGKVYFADSLLGFITADSGRCLRTTNGGASWQTIAVYSSYNKITDIRFYNSISGLGIMESGILLTTMNSGINWTQISFGNMDYFSCISTSKTIYGYISGHVYFWPMNQGPYIVSTSNGGASWVGYGTNSPYYYSKFDFLSCNGNRAITGVRGHYIYYRTTNAGSNWQYDTSWNNNIIDNSIFADSIIMYSITGHNIYKSINFGRNWSLSYQNNENLNCIFFINKFTGWAVGHYGSIIKTTNGGGTIGVFHIKSEIPENYYLSQNYPNPFNPRTRIKFDIAHHTSYPLSRGNFVILNIYDIQGKKIQTLVNESLTPGTYEVTFDGSNLSSGVYFYQLKTGDYIMTKKLILLK